MKNIRYDVAKNGEIVFSSESKKEAIEYAINNNCECVVKFDDFNFEPLGVVWDCND